MTHGRTRMGWSAAAVAICLAACGHAWCALDAVGGQAPWPLLRAEAEPGEDGSFTITWGEGPHQFPKPAFLTCFCFGVDGGGFVYVFDPNRNQFSVFDGGGKYQRRIPTGKIIVTHLYVHPDGVLFSAAFGVETTDALLRERGLRSMAKVYRTIVVCDPRGAVERLLTRRFDDHPELVMPTDLYVRGNVLLHGAGRRLLDLRRVLPRPIQDDYRLAAMTQWRTGGLSRDGDGNWRLWGALSGRSLGARLPPPRGYGLALERFLGTDSHQRVLFAVVWRNEERPGVRYSIVRFHPRGAAERMDLPQPYLHKGFRPSTRLPIVLAPSDTVYWTTLTKEAGLVVHWRAFRAPDPAGEAAGKRRPTSAKGGQR